MSIRGFLELVQAPHIHSLTLHLSHADPGQLICQLHPCLKAVATKVPTLETLAIHCGELVPAGSVSDLSRQAVDTGGSLIAVVEPLLVLHRLRHITLDFHLFVLRLASDEVRRLAEAWPDVEELLVDIATVDGGRAGLESTIHFARCCPHLLVLHLPAMDLVVGVFRREGLEYPPGPHLLQDLDVKEVMFPRDAYLSHEMVEFIQRVFPRAVVPSIKHPIIVMEESRDHSRLV